MLRQTKERLTAGPNLLLKAKVLLLLDLSKQKLIILIIIYADIF